MPQSVKEPYFTDAGDSFKPHWYIKLLPENYTIAKPFHGYLRMKRNR